MAYAYWRGPMMYVAFKDEHGREVQRSSKARTLTEGRKLAEELEAKAERIRLGLEKPQAEDVLYEEAVRLYLASLPVEYRSRPHLKSRFKRILPHLGKVPVRRMTAADVQRMLAANADASPQTREHLRVAVQGSYTWLVKSAKLASENPAAAVKKVRIPKKDPKYLRREDIPRLIAEVPEHWRPAFLTGLGTAVRKGEVLALLKRNWLSEERVLVVATSHDSATTKGDKERRVPVPEWLAPVLDAQLVTPGRFLFPNPEGKRWGRSVRLHDIMRRALVRAGLVEGYTLVCRRKGCGYELEADTADTSPCPRCGFKLWPKGRPLPVRFKDLRSTWATHAAAATGDIRFVQKVLGHGDPRVTEQRYAFALPQHLRAQAQRVDFGLAVSQVQGRGSKKKPLKATASEREVEET